MERVVKVKVEVQAEGRAVAGWTLDAGCWVPCFTFGTGRSDW